MDKSKFDVIFKTGRDQTVQCRGCGVKSPPVREGEGVENWCEAHKCGQEAVPVSDPAPEKVETPPDPDQETGEKDREDIPSREELEKMTKAVIMEKFSHEWDGTKADLVDFLLGEEEEEEEEEGEG